MRGAREHPDLLLGGLITLMALALRLGLVFRAPPFLILRDSASYAVPALELIHGEGFAPELKRPPLYPLFLAGSFWSLGQDLHGVLLLQHVIGALSVALSYILARRLWGRLAAVLAGSITAINGSLLINEHSIMAETLFSTLLVVTLLAATGVRGKHPIAWVLASGILLGLATLTRPGALMLAPLLAPILGWLTPGTIRRRALVGGIVIVGCVGTVLPWMVRNQLVHGVFTVAGGTGEALIARTTRHDRGFGRDAYVFRGRAAHLELDDHLASARRWTYRQLRSTDEADAIFRGLQRRYGLSEAEADGLMRQIGLHAIRQDFGRYVLTTAQMTVHLFVGYDKSYGSMWQSSGDSSLHDDWGPRWAPLLVPLTPAQEREQPIAEVLIQLYEHHRVGSVLAVLFMLGTASATVFPRFRPALPAAVVVVVLLGSSVALAGPLLRYRACLEPLIVVVAAGGLVGLREVATVLLRLRPAMPSVPDRIAAPR